MNTEELGIQADTKEVKVVLGGQLITLYWQGSERLVTVDEQGQYSAFSYRGWRDLISHIEELRPRP